MKSKRELVWTLLLGALAGGTLGFILSSASVRAVQAPWFVAVWLLVGAASWLEAPLQPAGEVNFAPAIFLAVSASVGVEAGMILAISAPVLPWLLSLRRRPLRGVLMHGVEDAVVLGALSLIASTVPRVTAFRLGSVATLGRVSLVFFSLRFVLLFVRTTLGQGIRPGRLFGPLLRSCAPHYSFLVGAAMTMYLVHRLIGPAGMLLAAIVLAEVYYPWRLLGEQRGLFMTSLKMIIEAVDLKDPYTSRHSQRVSNYAVMIARNMGLPETEVEQIRVAGLMHDIGKIGVKGSIIRKPSRLSDDEMESMRRHAEFGAAMIRDLGPLAGSGRIVRHHHEHFNGTGYPVGLAGEAIPLGSRIILVADAFDALTTDRPYRKGKSREEALEVLKTNAGSQFDPRAVAAFRSLLVQRLEAQKIP